MMVIGIDAHKQTVCAVAVDGTGRQLAQVTVPQSDAGHRRLLRWADELDRLRRFGVEDCRHLTGRLERTLVGAGETVTRVPPSLMAQVRKSVRTPGKSDPIDALAVARAVLREPELPTARLDGPDLDLKLLTDYRDILVAERTAWINRVRWHLYDVDPDLEASVGELTRLGTLDRLHTQLAAMPGRRARIAAEILTRIRDLTVTERVLTAEITTLVTPHAPSLLAMVGCGPLTAAKLVAETADITRFGTPDAYAAYNGTAPIPVWSGNTTRHRLNRGGNRQINAALHRIMITQLRYPGPARDLYQRLLAAGKPPPAARRILRRRLSDIIYRTLNTDHATTTELNHAA